LLVEPELVEVVAEVVVVVDVLPGRLDRPNAWYTASSMPSRSPCTSTAPNM
jgi:hypothetical protein